ncbi:hypothetical protein D9619_011522 [Psilocybe cf. subviscida]|uniref:Uncharacterized protein n=1 Tax=Psilocybe cf. subviscida TaxID=2480587 RepID=A0A8H5F9L7_9AGAR|nr:hypothetical protein D9619_011522 [Psilocybe cf. subviscida]
MLRLVRRVSTARRVFAVPTGGREVKTVRSAALRSCWKSQQVRSYHDAPAHPAPSEPPGTHPSPRKHRMITTFSPQKLVAMNQRIVDISGLNRISISPRGTADSDCSIRYAGSRAQGVWQDYPFPDNTTGVFYYHQPNTSPARLGELRFRLCADPQAFDTGSDLLLPSGQPWHINSQSLQLVHNYKPLRERLVEDGLLERDLYPGVPDSMLALGITPLTSIGQPFVVDLSASSFTIQLVSPGPQAASLEIRLYWVFRKRSNATQSLFSGRAVVCLEPYPYPASGSRSKATAPCCALRILEFLTPVKRLSANDVILDPVPGQLLMHRYRKSRHDYAPWGYSPSKAGTRTAITDWIRAQSTSPQLE